MNWLALLQLGLSVLGEIAQNPLLELDEDGEQVAGLVGLFANLVNRGVSAKDELEAFVNEIKELNESGAPVASSPLWDAITSKRKADLEALKALRG